MNAIRNKNRQSYKEDRLWSLDQDYGNCEGPGAMYVKLVSSDNHEFIVQHNYARASNKRGMLNGTVEFSENEINEIHSRNISSLISQKPLYKAKYSSNPLEMPNFEMPDFEMPDFEMPDFEMLDFEMPDFEMPDFEILDFNWPVFEILDLDIELPEDN